MEADGSTTKEQGQGKTFPANVCHIYLMMLARDVAPKDIINIDRVQNIRNMKSMTCLAKYVAKCELHPKPRWPHLDRKQMLINLTISKEGGESVHNKEQTMAF